MSEVTASSSQMPLNILIPSGWMASLPRYPVCSRPHAFPDVCLPLKTWTPGSGAIVQLVECLPTMH